MITITKEKFQSILNSYVPTDKTPEGLWLIKNALSSNDTHLIIGNSETSAQLFTALDISNKRFGVYDITNDLFIDSIQVPTQSKVTVIAGDPIAGDHLEDGYAGDFHNSTTGITSRWININGSLKSIQY